MVDQPPNLRHWWHVVRRQYWLIGLVFATAVAVAVVETHRQSPVYQASASVLVGQGGGVFQPQYGSSATVTPFVQTMANLLDSEVVARMTVNSLHLAKSPTSVLAGLNVSTTPDSSVIQVTYNAGHRGQAVRILTAMTSTFAKIATTKLGTTTDAKNRVTATVFDPSHLQGQVSPSLSRNVGMAAGLGLAIGLILAFVRDGFSSRIRSRRDAEQWFGAPVLATLPRAAGRTIEVEALDTRPRLEELSKVRASLQYLGDTRAGPVITITSASLEDGKTALVANLGVELARSGTRVICVEADLRRPSLCEHLSRPRPEHGLTDVLAGSRGLEEALVTLPVHATTNGNGRKPVGRLELLPAGHVPANASDLMTVTRIQQLVEDLQSSADYVLFDAPPILDGGDAFPFARASNDVIVAAREDRTTREAAEEAAATLRRLEVRRVSVVLVQPADHLLLRMRAESRISREG